MKRNEISYILNQYFNINELKTIFFRLDLDYERITTQSKDEVVDLLLDEISNLDFLNEFIEILHEDRPFLFNLTRQYNNLVTYPVPNSKVEFMAMDRTAMLKVLNDYFDIGHLYALANELDFSETSLPNHQTKQGFARDFIVRLERIGKVDALRTRLFRHFLEEEHIQPKQIEFEFVEDYPEKIRRIEMLDMQNSLPWIYERIAFYLSEGEFRTLCFNLGVDWEMLIGSDLESHAKSLVIFCKKMKRLNDLREALEQDFPIIDWASSRGI